MGVGRWGISCAASTDCDGAPTHAAARIVFLTKRSPQEVVPQFFGSTCAEFPLDGEAAPTQPPRYSLFRLT